MQSFEFESVQVEDHPASQDDAECPLEAKKSRITPRDYRDFHLFQFLPTSLKCKVRAKMPFCIGKRTTANISLLVAKACMLPLSPFSRLIMV
jgi:hypothetical protein